MVIRIGDLLGKETTELINILHQNINIHWFLCSDTLPSKSTVLNTKNKINC